eukprot:scaffold34159_cov58-Phaeocystis_antarctica.AAC.6
MGRAHRRLRRRARGHEHRGAAREVHVLHGEDVAQPLLVQVQPRVVAPLKRVLAQHPAPHVPAAPAPNNTGTWRN